MRGRSRGKAEEAERKKEVDMNEKSICLEVFAMCCLTCFAVLFGCNALRDVLSVWMFWATFGTDLVLFGYLWMWFLRRRYTFLVF